MPTLYKPQLIERFTYRPDAIYIREWLSENDRDVLGILRFHDEHGKPGDFEGGFDKQIQQATNDLLDEITGILVETLPRMAATPPGVTMATLDKIAKQPALGLSPLLPGEVDWLLAHHYQRGEEKPGTFWSDVMRIHPKGFKGIPQPPTELGIRNAAVLAQEYVRQRRRKGRPSIDAHEPIAAKLGSIFLRYQPSITRITEVTPGTKASKERGEFLDFVDSVLPPLNTILRQRRLACVTALTIVRQAAQIYPR
jgi:hypothetical protein